MAGTDRPHVAILLMAGLLLIGVNSALWACCYTSPASAVLEPATGFALHCNCSQLS